MAGPPRKRMKRREEVCHRYLTFSTYRRLPLLGNARIRDAFVEQVAAARRATLFRLVAWVVMPEHVHIIVVPAPEFPVPRILTGIKKEFAERVLARWRVLGAAVLPRLEDKGGLVHFWQRGGGFDRNVRSEDELAREIGYIHRNPVKRGLAARPEDWAWSSARWYAGMREGESEIDLPRGRPLEEHLKREGFERSVRERNGDGPP